jgi:hypothetical protein
MKNTGLRWNTHPRQNAMMGRKKSCPMSPANTGFGRLRIIWKSAGLRVRPNSNISSIKMGITISIVIAIV